MYLSWLLCWSWSTTKAQKVDSLKPGDESFVLHSKQGKFYITFGVFFGYNKQTYLYISNTYAEHDVAWFYDRNCPINLDSPVLSLDKFGVLKIESKTSRKLPIIIYSSPQPINNTVATILDTGNFVLEQIHHNGTKSLLWQSFDHPIYTLIPTMKLGVNRKTGHNWSLVSTLTSLVVNSGEFSLEWEPKQGELNIKKRGKVYWKSGKLGRNGLFENIPANVQHMYQYNIVSNKDEDSFSLKVKDHQNYKKIIGWELDSTGKLMSDEGEIGNADMCYGYNIDGGCQKWEDIPTCRDQGEVFQEKKGTPIFGINTTTVEDNAQYGYSDCKAICWRNCNCTGFELLYNNGTACLFYSWNSTKNGNFSDDIGNFYLLVIPPIKEAPKVAHHG
jgi:hypothetical protein